MGTIIIYQARSQTFRKGGVELVHVLVRGMHVKLGRRKEDNSVEAIAP